ncbi:LytR/AlgR family response regulator transcription factor [Bacteroidota bacterium]
MIMDCLIVDDEPIARLIIKNYIERLSSLNIIGECKNALEAISFLHQYKVDILFLDIKMPDMTGLELLKTFVVKPNVILTTAYSEFAVESYEYNVIDYLLKPFSFDRFLTAINKIEPKTTRTGNQIQAAKNSEYIYLKHDKTIQKVYLKDIIYLQSYGNYVKVFTETDMLLVQKTLAGIAAVLPEDLFIRIHKSYVVSINKIENFNGTFLYINNVKLPIGKYYKQWFIEKMK